MFIPLQHTVRLPASNDFGGCILTTTPRQTSNVSPSLSEIRRSLFATQNLRIETPRLKMTQDSGTSTIVAPTIILIPASFTPASFYANVVDRLRKTGFEVIIHTLPSASRNPPENAATLAEDATFFGDIAKRVADQGKDFAYVMHSYGGIVGSEASRGLSKKERRAVGKQGGLIRLVYITSVVPALGNSLNDVLGNPDNLAMEVSSACISWNDQG